MGVQQSKRTKIVCTMGPASDSELTLRNLIAEGMDIARLNFSHGSQIEHLARINRIKKVRRELNAPTAIMLDLRGPRIRTGALVDGAPVRLQAGKQITLTEAPVAGTSRLVQQTCAGLADYMRPGTSILIDNGLIELAVDETRGSDIVCTVQNSGILREHKGMNFPGTQIDLPIMSEHDERDLLFGIEQGVDFVAVPAVRDAADLAVVRAFLDGNGGAGIGLIAKIENERAVDNVAAIVDACDGVVIARGDLGVEMDTERVPHIQKQIVRLCNERRVPVIVAGQMLESMIGEPRATRSDVADVASAVYDGVDALMLSSETALGKYPGTTVRMMVRIAAQTERYLAGSAANAAAQSGPDAAGAEEPVPVSPMVARAAVQTAHAVNAGCIVCPTSTGRTARAVSKLRPRVPIYAVAPSEQVMRRMQLFWGVTPMSGGLPARVAMQQTIANAQEQVLARGLVKPGDLAVFTAGDAQTSPETSTVAGEAHAGTNVMYVVQIKDSETNA